MTRETYQKMRERQQNEYNAFSKTCMFFAFSNEQFNEGMKKLGLNTNDTDKIYSIGLGGFILRTKSKEQFKLLDRFDAERKNAIKNDKDGTGFIKEMFEYEMYNHEYGYTRDISDTLDALGITAEEIATNENLSNGFNIARKIVLDYADKND